MGTIAEDLKTGQYAQVYLLYGEENYLVRQYTQRLADALLPAEDSMNRTVFSDRKTELREIISLCDTMPFFADRRVVVLRDLHLCSPQGAPIADYIKAGLPEYLTLIISESEADKRSALYKAVEKAGRIQCLDRLDEAGLLLFVGRILSYAQLRIRKADAQYFLSRIGNDMNRIRNETEKLIAYCSGQGEVTRQDIEAISSVTLESRIFDFLRYIAEGRKKDAMTALDVLIRTREDETRMLGMIGRQVRQMLQTKRLSAQGIRSADEIARAIGVQSFVARNYLRWNTRYSEEDLAGAAERCAAAEEEIKTGRTDAKVAFILTVTSLLQEKS
ncbi:MAG: DNA polymerase III subunit delta [Lachnospiraceae bacterium]|nr:DNA polymerase III subunit delta [Lachnospiraceae bacterium]